MKHYAVKGPNYTLYIVVESETSKKKFIEGYDKRTKILEYRMNNCSLLL